MALILDLYGQIQLNSFASVSNPLVGITSESETFATVRLGQANPDWNVTTQPSGYNLRFSIGQYPYTGLEDGVTVIATTDSSQDVAWSSTYIDNAGAYVIYPADDSSVAWTVQDFDDSTSAIVLQSRDDTSSSQWFKVIDYQ